MKKKLVGMLILAMTATTILGGCGSKEGKEETSDGKVKIRFASWDTAEDVERQQKLVDQFNAEHDDIEVTLEAYGSDFDTKISAGMGSGDTPDVMYMWNYPAYADGLEPLDSYIEKEGEDYKSNFYDTLWNYNSLDDTTYGIPVGFTTKTIYEKCGVKGFSFQMKPDPYDFEMYLWSNGAAYTDEDGNLEKNLNSKKSKEVFEMFQEMEKEEYAVATEKTGTDEFRAGNTAMYVYGSWAINSLEEDGMNYGVVNIPSFADADHPSVSILSSSGISTK